jgi:outer membrane protein TolC
MNERFRIPEILRPIAWGLAGLALALPLQADSVTVRTYANASRVAPATAEDLAALGVEMMEGKLALSLQDAVAIALERNLSIDIERFRRSQVGLGITEAYGIYDLQLDSVALLDSDTAPVSSTLQMTGGDDTVTDRVAVWNSSLTQLTPFGGTAVLDFNNQRFSSSDQAFQPNPRFSVNLDFTLTQPLLRGFGRTATEQNILLARNSSAIGRESFQAQVEQVISDVVTTYWALVEAQEQLKVAEESLTLAKELDSMNRIQVEVGTLAPLELVQSEAGVAAREEAIIQQQAAVEDNSDLLRQLLNLAGGELWDVEIQPVTEPEVEHAPIDTEQAVKTALEERPDLRSQRLRNDSLEVQRRAAKNAVLPQLNLVARYGSNAIAGDVVDIDPDTGEETVLIDSGYSDALSDLTGFDSRGWQVSLNFSYPLQNRTARARYATAELAEEEGDFTLRALEQTVLIQVRQAARAVETAAKRIDSAKVSSRLERENLDAQRKRYENGLATSFEVLQIQEDLSEARSREVSAVISYRIALSQFHQAVGRLLKQNGVELEDQQTQP